jgi:NAD-dependent deacetylase
MSDLLTSAEELRALRTRLQQGAWRHVVVLTGAGISVASGLPTYRGPGGLWTRPENAELPDAALYARDPSRLWALFGPLRSQARAARPNAAHLALAEWESKRAQGRSFTLVTQNVDGLHARAGSRNVVELHGSLLRTRCGNPSGTVAPASSFVRGAKYAGAWTLLVNLTPMRPRHPDFDVEVLGRAEDLLPMLLGDARGVGA